MKRFVLVLFCLLAFPVVASHIVGGEFEIIHISGNTYRINMILYFDKINGSIGARDANVNARIFRKSDNAIMRTVSLPLISEENVSYTQPECSEGEIVTSKIIYSTTVVLSDDDFSDPAGYYIAWERCCRNYEITNVISNDPNAGGGQFAGQTFYLEFPPIVKDGQPFVNSTPRLFPPLNDYACPRKLYYVDFAGTDDDGDSLVYSLVTPLNTWSADALPPGNQLPRPGPYPEVAWEPGFGPGKIINPSGIGDLKISSDGFLAVTPELQGLFVFAVKCEEFRDGVKLGEVRRDFQMLVLDKCPQAEPPQILGKISTEAIFTHDNNMTVTFPYIVPDENPEDDRCIQVQISDPDASKADDSFMEKIHIKAIPLNFKKNDPTILPEITSATLINGSTKEFTICFDKCPPFEGAPFQVGILAYDDACSLPLYDTLKVLVNITPPPNAKPVISPDVTYTIQEGQSMAWDIEATDADGDPLTIGIITDGFSLQDYGMKLEELAYEDGLYQSRLTWDAQCDVYDFSDKSNFRIMFIVEDLDDCSFSKMDTMTFNLNILFDEQFGPAIGTDLSPDQVTNGVTMKIFETLSFNIFGSDHVEKDYIELTGKGKGFEFNEDITFEPVGGNEYVISPFTWLLNCDKFDLNANNYFELEFTVRDEVDNCGFHQTATLTVMVNVEPPDNLSPDLAVVNTNPDLHFANNEQSILMGQQISLGLIAQDGDVVPEPDHVSIDLVEASGNVSPEGYVFAPAEGIGTAQTTFSWNPDCSIFENGIYENNYTFKFLTRDDRCFNAKGDTVAVKFNVRDIDPGNVEFLPPNIVTPNGDPYNEFFGMVRQDAETGEMVSILPPDNCVGRFVSINVYNRWGREVFASNIRDFRWYPREEAAGVYFYTLKYSDREYKGTITLRN